MLLFESYVASGLRLLNEMKGHHHTRSPEAWRLFPKSGKLLIDIFSPECLSLFLSTNTLAFCEHALLVTHTQHTLHRA